MLVAHRSGEVVYVLSSREFRRPFATMETLLTIGSWLGRQVQYVAVC